RPVRGAGEGSSRAAGALARHGGRRPRAVRGEAPDSPRRRDRKDRAAAGCGRDVGETITPPARMVRVGVAVPAMRKALGGEPVRRAARARVPRRRPGSVALVARQGHREAGRTATGRPTRDPRPDPPADRGVTRARRAWRRRAGPPVARAGRIAPARTAREAATGSGTPRPAVPMPLRYGSA